MDENLVENRKEFKARAEFARDQKDVAYHSFLVAGKNVVDFKKKYQMPAELRVSRDVELQLEKDQLESKLKLALERYNYMDQIHLETLMKEAGIVGNVSIIGPPTTTFAPSRIAGKKLVNYGIIIGLVLAIAIPLLLDFISGPIRHESDIEDVVQIPILGYIPRV